MQDVYILSAVRTPIGRFGGSLASMTAADMGVVAAKAAIERARVHPKQVEETIFGNARQAGGGPNPARQISIRSGVPQEIPAYTVNKACASGLKSIALGFQEITTGNLDCVLAGRTESISRWRTLGIPAGQSGSRRRNVSRRIFLPDGEDGHGGNGRSARRAVQNLARGAGSVRAVLADAGGAGDWIRTFQ